MTFPPHYVIRDECMIFKVVLSGLTGADRHQNWPTSFVVRGTPRSNLKSTRRAAKVYAEMSFAMLFDSL